MNFVFGYNVLWVVVALMTVAYYGRRLYLNDLSPDAKHLALGVVLVAAGAVFQRGYWAGWQWFLSVDPDHASWFPAHSSLLTPFVGLIVIGYGLHLRPRVQTVFGRWWFPAWIGGSFVLFIVASALPLLWSFN